MPSESAARTATVYLVLDSREHVVSVAANKRVAESIITRHARHGFGGYRIESWAVRYAE